MWCDMSRCCTRESGTFMSVLTHGECCICDCMATPWDQSSQIAFLADQLVIGCYPVAEADSYHHTPMLNLGSVELESTGSQI